MKYNWLVFRKKFLIFFTLSLIWLILVHSRIIDFLQYLSFELSKVDENCMKDVLLGLAYLDRSSLVSAFIWLKYHKKTHLPNCSTCVVVKWGEMYLNHPDLIVLLASLCNTCYSLIL